MSIFRIEGDRILSMSEFRASQRSSGRGAPRAVQRGVKGAPSETPNAQSAALLRHQGALIAEVLGARSEKKRRALRAVAPPSIAPFTPIGLGIPLTVLISHVYTGKYPKTSLFESSEDMLLTTACKEDSVFNAMPRAVNYLVPGVKPKTGMKAPPAITDGTRVVFYSPALTIDSLILTLEIKFHDFGPDLIRKVADAAGTAAGLPIFLPASTYMLAASSLLKVAANVGQALFDRNPVFSVTETLDFAVAGNPIAQADFRLLTKPDFDHSGLEYQPGTGLVSKMSAKPYDGDAPYVVISLDGAEKPKLANFTPTHASAAVLEKFYSVSDASGAAIDGFIDAMKVVNDLRFRNDADKLLAQIAKSGNADQKAALQAQLDADLKNISDDRLKPAAGS